MSTTLLVRRTLDARVTPVRPAGLSGMLGEIDRLDRTRWYALPDLPWTGRPPGTHGRNHGADRSRLDFSNYGALIDAQGWGREVTTCGYGDLQGGANEAGVFLTQRVVDKLPDTLPYTDSGVVETSGGFQRVWRIDPRALEHVSS